MEGVLRETENMLARGGLDLPLTQCFAAIRGDDLLMQQLLRRGLDPNEADNNRRTPLHISASKGSENCVLLLLDYGADPNSRDSDGSVPLWEAILGKHEGVIKLLMDNGADICSADVGEFACTAAEQNSLELLEDIIRYCGDITSPRSNGSTAMHLAVCEGNAEVVKFLLDRGADMDKADINGWSPRDLADQQGHEEIKAIFQAKKGCIERSRGPQAQVAASEPPNVSEPTIRFVGMFLSEPSIRVAGNEGGAPVSLGDSSGRNRRRRKTNNFHNSLFGIMSAVQEGERRLPPAVRSCLTSVSVDQRRSVRVTVRSPQVEGSTPKLVLLPGTLGELLSMGSNKFGLSATRVLTEEGAEVDDIAVIRDGDRLLLVRPEEEHPSARG